MSREAQEVKRGTERSVCSLSSKLGLVPRLFLNVLTIQTKNIVFRNPNPGPGEEPWIKWRNE